MAMHKAQIKSGDKLPAFHRNLTLTKAQTDAKDGDDDRLVRGVSISSEEPYSRFFGAEILSHKEGAINLARLNGGACPVLFNHERSQHLGKVVNARVEDGRLVVDFLFGRSPLALEKLQDVRDGILTETSLTYIVHKFEVDEDEETYTATDWEVLEAGPVTIPADHTVGVGRDFEKDGTPVVLNVRNGVDTFRSSAKSDQPQNKSKTMTPEEIAAKKLSDEKAEQERQRAIDDGIAADMQRRDNINATVELYAKRGVTADQAKPFLSDRKKSAQDFKLWLVDNVLNTEPTELGRKSAGGTERNATEAAQPLDLGDAFTRSEGYKANRGDGRKQFSVEFPFVSVRATATLSGLNITAHDRQPGLVQLDQQRLTIADLLAPGTTSLNSIKYLRETSYINSATAVAEGALKPEATWALSEVDAPVKKVAITSKVTDELFNDQPSVMSYINGRMRFMVEEAEEDQILNGTGVGANLTGILNTAGIQTQAKGVDSAVDAIFKAIMDKVFTIGRAQASGIVMHPTNWSAIRLLKDANNQYYGGGPFTGAYGNPGSGVMFEMLWGLPVVVTTRIAAGTALVGDFRRNAQIFRRQGITIDSTNSNEDDFKKNLIALRAEERFALAVYRPPAFASVTGL